MYSSVHMCSAYLQTRDSVHAPLTPKFNHMQPLTWRTEQLTLLVTFQTVFTIEMKKIKRVSYLLLSRANFQPYFCFDKQKGSWEISPVPVPARENMCRGFFGGVLRPQVTREGGWNSGWQLRSNLVPLFPQLWCSAWLEASWSSCNGNASGGEGTPAKETRRAERDWGVDGGHSYGGTRGT